MKEYRADRMNGTVVDGRYEVRDRLARGGMSTVYLAVDRRLDREVALKVLYPHLAEDPALVQRFEQEAKTAARLSHPHVVNVLDQGVDDQPDGDLAYLVMEYVPGYTLRTVLQRRRALSPRVALAYLEAMVDGLAAAHRAGLVHRDMKPENVLVSRDGQIKVADFGLARATTNFTGTGAALLGTVAYISPELVSGSPADERSDVYAVGIMAYEMLTGSQPFTGASPIQVAYRHLNDEVPAPSEAVPGLAEELDDLVLWATAKDPQDRPADAGVLLTEIRRLRSSLSDADLDLEASTVDAEPAHRPGAEPDVDPDDQAGHVEGHDGGDLPPGATEALSPGVTEALDPGATTVLGDGSGPDEHPGHRATTVLPRQPDRPPLLPSLVPPTGSGRPSETAPRPPSGSPRQRRRHQARLARTPTEDLGRRHGPRMWWWAAAVVIITALLVLVGWFFGTGPGGMVTVPAIEGQGRTSAVEALEETGVDFTLAGAHHDVVARDSVIATEPAAGTELRRLDSVTVTLSLGPELFTVPEITGKDRGQAEIELVDRELSLGSVSMEHSASVPEGSVVRQSPAAGAELRRGHPVDVVLSDGPEPVAVPDLTGLRREEASEVLESAGLRVEVHEVLGGVFGGDGHVLRQTPEPGTELTRGETVTLGVL